MNVDAALRIKLAVFLAVFTLAMDCRLFSDSNADGSAARTSFASTPFILSLIVSHGSGLYKIDQPQKARPYLLANIFLVDFPLAALAGGIIMNKVSPEIFQGGTLKVAEYIANTLLISVFIAPPVIRFFECRDVLRETAK